LTKPEDCRNTDATPMLGVLTNILVQGYPQGILMLKGRLAATNDKGKSSGWVKDNDDIP
jgi:hypothetical protein